MANRRPTVDRSPAELVSTTTGRTGTDDHKPERPGGLGRLLDARLAFGQAQRMLAELTGCTLADAGKVLLQVGAQLGRDSAESAAEFFLVAAATAPGGPEAQGFIRQARNWARVVPGDANGREA